MPAVAHRTLGLVPGQARIALGLFPAALEVVLDVFETLAAIGAVAVVAEVVGRLVVAPLTAGRVVRRGGVVRLPVIRVRSRVHRFGDAVARGRTDDATDHRTGSHAQRATDRTHG